MATKNAKTTPKNRPAKPVIKKKSAAKKSVLAAAKKVAVKKPAAKRASAPAAKQTVRKAAPAKAKVKPAAPAKRTTAATKKAPAPRKAPVKAVVAQKKSPPKAAPTKKVVAPKITKKPAPTPAPARSGAPKITQPHMELPEIEDISSNVPGASEIDMSIFVPPKPLEAAAGEAISDDMMATLREMEATQEAVDRVRKNAKITPPPEFDGKLCVDCELEIEEGRRKLGYFTCIHCESEKERMAKLFAR